jgi:hypothetical protein
MISPPTDITKVDLLAPVDISALRLLGNKTQCAAEIPTNITNKGDRAR